MFLVITYFRTQNLFMECRQPGGSGLQVPVLIYPYWHRRLNLALNPSFQFYNQ